MELTLAIPLSRLFLFINKTVGLLKGQVEVARGVQSLLRSLWSACRISVFFL